MASCACWGLRGHEILWVIVGEGLVLGAVGTVLGLALGIGLGQGLVQLVARTINDLYFVITVSELQIVPFTLVKGCLLGLGATALATVVPGVEAAWAAPQAALRRSGLETRVRGLTPWLAICGVVMMLAALAVLLVSGKDLIAAFTALFLFILGLTLMTPAAVALVVRLVVPVASLLFGTTVQIALRGINASLSRSGVAIAALTLALSATVGVGVMIESFRATVNVWLASTLRADIYVATPSLRSSRTQAELDPRIIELVKDVPGIAQIASGRSVVIESEQGLTEIFTVRMVRDRAPRFQLKGGDPHAVWNAFTNNQAVLVSEPYAYHHDVETGQSIALRTDDGMRAFPVAGVYYDYDSGPGTVLMNRELYDRYWHDRAIDALGLYLSPGSSSEVVMDAIRKAIPEDADAMIRANKEIRQASLEIFDRTFTITHVLRMLAILVAFVGILSALMALQLERARELAVLRAIGCTPAQIGTLVTLQAGCMGLIAGVLALPLGLILAELLIHVINQRAFGWSMQTLVPVEVLVQSVALAVVAALLAGIYPGWKFARSMPAAALRAE